MQQLLHIVTGPADRYCIEKNKTIILDESFSSELQRLNAAARAIRALGYQIEAEQIPLHLPGARSEILLGAGQNLAALLEKSQGRWAQRVGDRVVTHTEFMGVLVSWEGCL